jgi:hypothetical protein
MNKNGICLDKTRTRTRYVDARRRDSDLTKKSRLLQISEYLRNLAYQADQNRKRMLQNNQLTSFTQVLLRLLAQRLDTLAHWAPAQVR